MQFKSLLLIAASIPTLAFAQNNYQTQYLTGTYMDQPPGYNQTSGQWKYGAEERLQQAQTQINWLEEDKKGQVENMQDRMSPNAPPQNFNEPTPRVVR